MKKKICVGLCVLLCGLAFTGCQQNQAAEVGEFVEAAQSQLGKTLKEAYTGMKLPGTPGEAVTDGYYLMADDSVDILGMPFAVVMMDNTENTSLSLTRPPELLPVLEREADFIEYAGRWDGDADYAIRLRDHLVELYGQPQPERGAIDLSVATVEGINALDGQEDPTASCIWNMEGWDLVYQLNHSDYDEWDGSLILEVKTHYDRPEGAMPYGLMQRMVAQEIDLAGEQMGKPLAEAYEAMGLPGTGESSENGTVLTAPEGATLLAQQPFDVRLEGSQEDGEDPLLERVIFQGSWQDNVELALGLRDMLVDAYGEPQEREFSPNEISIADATEESVMSLEEGAVAVAAWDATGKTVVYTVGQDGTLTIEVSEPFGIGG